MGAISVGAATWKAWNGEGPWSDVGFSIASFAGGYYGAQWGARAGAAAFGLFTGGVGWLVAGAIIGGGAWAWWGSLGAEKAWRWFEDFLKLNRDGKYRIHDPLALDLDGDGIETLAAAGFAGALFDHRNQGIRTATGWISADDGLLVRDLNGNGIIDNGGELFSDNTRLKDGSLAKHGYAALAELDTNGDKVISAADAAFSSLRVWRDLNQDGISQADELRTLEESGILSLNVDYKDINKNLDNGNTLAQEGSYTKTDGKAAQMGDLLLAADNLHSRFKDKIELTAGQARAANLSGIGRFGSSRLM